MTIGQRFSVAFACLPAWVTGVIVTVLVGTIIGEMKESGAATAEQLWTGSLLLLMFGMALTLPALLLSWLLAVVLAPWVIRRPLLFAGLSGLSGPAVMILPSSDLENMLATILIAVPGIFAAAMVFRQLLRSQQVAISNVG